MTLWSVATTFLLAAILWLNATLIASPYVNYVSARQYHVSAKYNFVLGICLLVLAGLYVVVNVGNFANEGLRGMFDTAYLNFILVGPIGQFAKFQVAAIIAWFIYAGSTSSSLKLLAFLMVILSLSISFFSMGHANDAPWWGKLAVFIHLFIAWLWFGSLSSLRQIATSLPPAAAKNTMEKFGSQMLVAVPILIIAGIIMYRSSSGQWFPQVTLTAYDIALLTKLALVIVILCIAAVHKFYFVPRLENSVVAKHLKTSITVELILGITIFIAAAALSSVFAPS